MSFENDSFDSQRFLAAEYEDSLDRVRYTLKVKLAPELADALSRHAEWFLDANQCIDLLDVPTVDPAEAYRRTKMPYDGHAIGQRWIVRDKEIDSIARLTPIAVAIAGTGGPLGVAVALVMSSAAAANAFRKKKVELGERDFALLMFMKHGGPMSETALLDGLNEIRTRTQFTWQLSHLRTDLERLQKVTLSDGTVDALVAKAGNGNWSVNGF